MKKFLAILLALTMILSLCACGGKGDQEETSGKDENGKVTLSIGIATDAMIMSLEDNALTRWVEDTCNVNLKFVEYSGGTDISTQISTTVAARQELPDILYGLGLNDEAIAIYGKDGYFLDLTHYYEDKEGASKIFWDRIEESLTTDQQEYIVRTITDNDTGKIYGVPSVETSAIDKRAFQPWINQTWLDKLGLPMPQNIDDLYNVLVAFNTQDPNGNGNPDDEIPLFGSEKGGSSAAVCDWIINMFLYYNSSHKWQDYNGDGQLEYVYTQDAYREALRFLNKLYKEELLSNMIYTASNTDMKAIITPTAGAAAMVGVFCGHLTMHTNMGNETLYEYTPMPLWGNAIEGDLSCALKTFITADCDYPDEAFNVLMNLWSWEGSMRVRYGEYGVNWTDPDPGAKSDMGFDAEYKLISDPIIQMNTAHWGKIASCFNHYAEGETAQIDENMDEWTARKSQMHAESRRIFDEAVKHNEIQDPTPTLIFTTEEKDATEHVRSNVGNYAKKQEMAFITGIGADINSDADWAAFQAEMVNLGLEEFQQLVQMAFERQ